MKIEKFVDVLCGWSCIEVEKEYDINGNVHKLFGLWKSKPGRNKGELRVAKRWQQMDAQCRREARREGKGRRRKKLRMDFATANLKLREGTKKRDSLIALICGSPTGRDGQRTVNPDIFCTWSMPRSLIGQAGCRG